MVDDLDNAASGTPVDSNSSTDSGISTDTSDPGVELSTQIALLNSSTNLPGPTDTDDRKRRQHHARATAGTIDWLNPGAENDPLFTDSADQGDGEQQTGSGMVDDQGNTFGSLSNSSSSTGTDGPTDPSEPDAELSTDIALLLNSATNSPSSTDTDTERRWRRRHGRDTWDHRLAQPRSRERPTLHRLR